MMLLLLLQALSVVVVEEDEKAATEMTRSDRPTKNRPDRMIREGSP